VGAVEQVTALAWLQRTLLRRKDTWTDQRNVYRRTKQAWGSERYADGVIEGLSIAITLINPALDQVERSKEVTKHNGC